MKWSTTQIVNAIIFAQPDAMSNHRPRLVGISRFSLMNTQRVLLSVVTLFGDLKSDFVRFHIQVIEEDMIGFVYILIRVN